MKKLIRVLSAALTGLGLAVGCLWLISAARAAKPGSSISFPSIQEIEPKIVLVDDYIDGDWRNELGGKNECWPAPGGTVKCDMKVTVNEGFLVMEYNVPVTSYVVAATELSSLNMTHLDTILVAVKGAKGNEPIYIEVRDCVGHVPKEKIGDHLVPGISSTTYSAVAIPRSEYVDIKDWRCIDRLNIIPSGEIGSGQGTISIDDIRLLPPKVVLDDFLDNNNQNELGGDSNEWESSTGKLKFDYLQPEQYLQLDYVVTKTNPVAEAVYFTKFRNTNLLLQKDALFFKVRGEIGGEEIGIEFRDCGLGRPPNIPKIKISDYLADGITKEWQQVSIPLAAFARGMNWRCVDQLNILFSAHPWMKSGQGRVFFDDITLAPTPHPIPLIIDNFDDCNKWNAQLWEWVSDTNNQASINFRSDTTNRYGSRGCGLSITYTVENNNSGVWLRSALDGLDIRDYTHLHFVIRGAVGGEKLHVYLRDKNHNERYYNEDIIITEYWQDVFIPLSYFKPAITLANLSELRIAFEWSEMSGTIYLDDFSFMKPQPQSFLPLVLKYNETPCQDNLPSCPAPYNNFEPNNLRCSAQAVLKSNSPIQSYICAANDIDDYYLISIDKLSPVSAQLTNLPQGVDYDLYLYHKNKIVAKSQNYGNTKETLNYIPTTLGIYYLRVYPYSGHSLHPYTLQASFQ